MYRPQASHGDQLAMGRESEAWIEASGQRYQAFSLVLRAGVVPGAVSGLPEMLHHAESVFLREMLGDLAELGIIQGRPQIVIGAVDIEPGRIL